MVASPTLKPRPRGAQRAKFGRSTWDNATRYRYCKALYTGSIPVAASAKCLVRARRHAQRRRGRRVDGAAWRGMARGGVAQRGPCRSRGLRRTSADDNERGGRSRSELLKPCPMERPRGIRTLDVTHNESRMGYRRPSC